MGSFLSRTLTTYLSGGQKKVVEFGCSGLSVSRIRYFGTLSPLA